MLPTYRYLPSFLYPEFFGFPFFSTTDVSLRIYIYISCVWGEKTETQFRWKSTTSYSSCHLWMSNTLIFISVLIFHLSYRNIIFMYLLLVDVTVQFPAFYELMSLLTVSNSLQLKSDKTEKFLGVILSILVFRWSKNLCNIGNLIIG